MAVANACANCGTPLPEDQPAGHAYCATCAAAWQGTAKPATSTCANCGTPLPADQPAGHGYCASCAAAWRSGRG